MSCSSCCCDSGTSCSGSTATFTPTRSRRGEDRSSAMTSGRSRRACRWSCPDELGRSPATCRSAASIRGGRALGRTALRPSFCASRSELQHPPPGASRHPPPAGEGRLCGNGVLLRGALQVRMVLHGRESGGRAALAGYLRRPRYEVLPTEDVEALVTTHVPPEVTITITASPRRGMEATINLAERLSRQGYNVVPHLSARLIRDAAHLGEILDAIKQMG